MDDQKAEIERLFKVLWHANVKDYSEYMRNHSIYVGALEKIDTMSDDENCRDIMLRNGLIAILAKHIEGQDLVLSQLSSEALSRCFKQEYQNDLIQSGVINHIFTLLKMFQARPMTQPIKDLICSLMDTIAFCATDHYSSTVIIGGVDNGIPTLVSYLRQFGHREVQRSSSHALAFISNNIENSVKIWDCNVFPTIVQLLCCRDNLLLRYVLQTLNNFAAFSPNLITEYHLVNAILPIVRLLVSTCCTSVKRQGVILLRKMVAAAQYYQVLFITRGVIPAVMPLLQSSDELLKEYSVTLTSYLAMDLFSQVTIVQNDGLMNLLKLLEENYSSTVGAIIFRLASNPDITCDFIRAGADERLRKYIRDHEEDDAVSDVVKLVTLTLNQLQERHTLVLNELLIVMQDDENPLQERINIAITLAHFSPAANCRSIFLEHYGLDVIMSVIEPLQSEHVLEAVRALRNLEDKALSMLNPYAPPPPPMHQQVTFDTPFVDRGEMPNVSFLVNGRRFYGHKNRFTASSDLFRGVFGTGWKPLVGEKVITDVKRETFLSILRFIYNGWVDIVDNHWELLVACNVYGFVDLKRFCEHEIAREIDENNLLATYDCALEYSAFAIIEACVHYVLVHFQALMERQPLLLKRVVPQIRQYIVDLLSGKSS